MTVEQLINMLNQFPPTARVILARDSETFSTADCVHLVEADSDDYADFGESVKISS